MRGLRRFCVGMAVLMSSWTTPATWAQSPQPSPVYGSGALAWPPPGMAPSQDQAGPYMGTMPSPLMQSAPGQMPQSYHSQGQIPQPHYQQAQYQQMQYPQGPGQPGPQGGPPVPVPAPYYGPGSEFNPYPGLDMYRYGWQQTTNENGLWFSDRRNAQKKYVFGVEFIVPVYSGPGDQRFGYGGIATGIRATDRVPPFWFSSPRLPGDFTGGGGQGGGGGGGGNNASLLPPDVFTRYFPERSFGTMASDNSSNGIRLNFGVENEDGGGVQLNAWYGGSSEQVFREGGIPTRSYTPALDPFDLIGNDPLYIFELSAMNSSLPINNGTGVAERIPFDTMFEMRFSQEAWGAGLRITRPAIARASWYQLRPVLGVRYIDLREGFRFRGLDSGAEYEIINYEDIDYVQEFETLFNLDAGFASTGTTANIGDAGFEGRPDASTFNDDDLVPSLSFAYPLDFFPTNPYETQIIASNHARLAGPEFGLQLDLGGGQNFKIRAHTIGGLAAARERLQLDGFGVFNHFVNRVDPDNNALTPDGGLLGSGVGGITQEQSRFRDDTTTTHVSPTFDAGINVEARLFSYVPVLRNMSLLEKAKFRTGYEFLYVGNISRPQSSVEYVSFPINPSLNPKRSGWTMTQWSFGVDWHW